MHCSTPNFNRKDGQQKPLHQSLVPQIQVQRKMSFPEHSTKSYITRSNISFVPISDVRYESKFLSQYLADLLLINVRDKLSSSIYTTLPWQNFDSNERTSLNQRFRIEQQYLTKKPSITENLFFALKDFNATDLTTDLRNFFCETNEQSSFENPFNFKYNSQSDRIVFEIYSNPYFSEYHKNRIRKSEMIFVECLLCASNDSLKSVLYDIQDKITQQFNSQIGSNKSLLTSRSYAPQEVNQNYFIQTFNQYYGSQSIVVILFVNCDVNFDFQKYLNKEEFTVGEKKYFLKLQVVYISKKILKDHFLFKHKFENNGEYIGERLISIYNLRKMPIYRKIVYENQQIVREIIEDLVLNKKRKILKYFFTSLTLIGFIGVLYNPARELLTITGSYFQNTYLPKMLGRISSIFQRC